MLELINQITDKPDWQRKVFDREILKKWKAEALKDPVVLSRKMFRAVSSV